MPAPHGITTIGEIRRAIACLPDDAIAVVDLWTQLDIRQWLVDWIRDYDGETPLPDINVNDPATLAKAANHIPMMAWDSEDSPHLQDEIHSGFEFEFASDND